LVRDAEAGVIAMQRHEELMVGIPLFLFSVICDIYFQCYPDATQVVGITWGGKFCFGLIQASAIAGLFFIAHTDTEITKNKSIYL